LKENAMDENTKEKYSKLFFIGALWNICFATGGLLMPKLIDKILFGFKSAITSGSTAFGLKLTWALVFVFGIGYYIVSRDPEKNRGIVWMGIFGKLAFFFTTVQYYFKKTITLLTPILAFGDFVFSVLFALFLVRTKDEAKCAVHDAA
jgi:hypothetical protein